MAEEEKIVSTTNFNPYGTQNDHNSLACSIKKEQPEQEMDMKTKIGFGSGHVFNDIVANAGSGYALLFYTTVIRLSNVHAGLIFMIGNVADAFAVIATGCMIDMDFRCRVFDLYGKLKTWHLVGTICLLATYILEFLPPLGIEIEELITIYYATIFVVSN